MNESPAVLADPSDAIRSVFRDIERVRMAGLPFVNPRLEVEAVGFAPWSEYWLGVLVTPWCMNLMLLPASGAARLALAAGEKRRFAFPAGTYEFIGAEDSRLGPFAACSLFSPPLEFEDQATALEVARLAREALLSADHGTTAQAEAASREAERPAAGAAPLSVARRTFLGGGRTTGAHSGGG